MNKVFTGGDSITTSKFLTDNERTVFSGGGITPDSIVNFEIEGEITRDLLAKGLFFQFADHFYYANSAIKFNDLNDEKLYNEFKNYLVQQKYTYHSESEHELDKLIKEVDKKKLGDNLSSDLKKIKTQFEMLGINELSTFKAEVIREIREEVASRYLGSEGRVREFLNNDKQLKAALDLISTSNYQKLLGSKNN